MKVQKSWRQICLLILSFGLLIVGTWHWAPPVAAASLTQQLVLHQKDQLAAKTNFKVYDVTSYLQKALAQNSALKDASLSSNGQREFLATVLLKRVERLNADQLKLFGQVTSMPASTAEQIATIDLPANAGLKAFYVVGETAAASTIQPQPLVILVPVIDDQGNTVERIDAYLKPVPATTTTTNNPRTNQKHGNPPSKTVTTGGNVSYHKMYQTGAKNEAKPTLKNFFKLVWQKLTAWF